MSTNEVSAAEKLRILKTVRDNWKQELDQRRLGIESAIRSEKIAFRRWIRAEREYREAGGQ